LGFFVSFIKSSTFPILVEIPMRNLSLVCICRLCSSRLPLDYLLYVFCN